MHVSSSRAKNDNTKCYVLFDQQSKTKILWLHLKTEKHLLQGAGLLLLLGLKSGESKMNNVYYLPMTQ